MSADRACSSLNSESEQIYAADSVICSNDANGASKRYGVEWSNYYLLNDWLLLDADFAWMHARYANRNHNGQFGDDIPSSVPKVASIGITARHLGPWTLDAKLRYRGEEPLSQDGSLTGPSAFVTNLRAERHLSPSTTLSFDVLNLFDRRYYDIAYEQDYRVNPTSRVVPEGITVHPGKLSELRVTLRLSLQRAMETFSPRHLFLINFASLSAWASGWLLIRSRLETCA